MRKRIRYLAQGIYTLEVTTNQLVSYDYDPSPLDREDDDDDEERKSCFKSPKN